MNVIHYVFITAVLMFAATFAGYSSAQGFGIMLPRGDNPEVLPEHFPCQYKEYGNEPHLRCRWGITGSQVKLYNDQTGRYETHPTEIYGNCTNDGECYVRGEYIGHSGIPGQIRIALHYYVGPAEDGKAVAYRMGTGPGFDGEPVSWEQALADYHQYMLRFGFSQQQLFEEMYNGTGIAKEILAAVITGQSTPPSVSTATQPVTEAWCNPRLDDDCYINNVKVPMAQLGNYLPAITDADAEARGGHCEYPLCYDGDAKPIGYRQSF